jgi:ABC-type Mn2+/Zn2+ transport system permease subunit
MNGAYIHLLTNHLPIIGSIFAFCLLIAGMFWKSDHLKHAALVTVIISALFSIGSYITGEDAEHVVEDIIGINHEALEEHEEAAEISMWALIITGAISLGTLAGFYQQKKYSGPLVWLCLAFLFVSVLLTIHTGKEGGMIRHTELLRTDIV